MFEALHFGEYDPVASDCGQRASPVCSCVNSRALRWPRCWCGGTWKPSPQTPRLGTTACGHLLFRASPWARTSASCGPGQGHWLALAEASATGIEARLEPMVTSVSVFDQSDARVLLELSGRMPWKCWPKALHSTCMPRAFKTGDAASTSGLAHRCAVLANVPDAPSYRLLVTRTYFMSFWRWLAASAAEFGAELLPPRRYTNAGDSYPE